MLLHVVNLSYSRAAIEDSKKWGMLNIVNQLFKIYFKVNNKSKVEFDNLLVPRPESQSLDSW